MNHIQPPTYPGDSTQITRNFSFHELYKSADTLPPSSLIPNLYLLCSRVLQPLRDQFGAFTPNSCYRSLAYDRRLKGRSRGWISTSQHTKGQAVDVPPVGGYSLMSIAVWVQGNLEFDQLILESGCVHVSISEVRRGLVLTEIKRGKKTYYVAGLKGRF